MRVVVEYGKNDENWFERCFRFHPFMYEIIIWYASSFTGTIFAKKKVGIKIVWLSIWNLYKLSAYMDFTLYFYKFIHVSLL